MYVYTRSPQNDYENMYNKINSFILHVVPVFCSRNDDVIWLSLVIKPPYRETTINSNMTHIYEIAYVKHNEGERARKYWRISWLVRLELSMCPWLYFQVQYYFDKNLSLKSESLN